MTHAVFYKQIKTLHLDFYGRLALNTDAADMRALSVPTLVRVYQLRDRKIVENSTYDELLRDGDHVLNADLLGQHSVVVKPGEGVQLNVPLHKEAKVIAIAGLFREPDVQINSWRLTLSREELDSEQARIVELGDNRLTLRADKRADG